MNRPTSDPLFATRIAGWQREHGRNSLPWQNTRDAYRIWLSEIMLQQTQVATVLGYYERFLASCPTVHALADASDDAVMALWAGLGYYSRARNLHKAAKLVVEKHSGVFPNDVNALAELPGIGRSTAAAIAAFAYDTIAPILDGNVKRVLARHAGIEGFPGVSAVEKKLWAAAEARLPHAREDMVAYTQGLMDLGATVCTKASPTCMLCPVASDCKARIDGKIDEIPAPKPSKALPHKMQRYLLALHADTVLLVKRPPQGIWGGLWCLPELSNDVPPGEMDAASKAKFAIEQIENTAPLASFDHSFTHFKLTLQPLKVDVSRVGKRLEEGGSMWIALGELERAALPKPIKTLLSELVKSRQL
ncbi:MAG: A/G-specific adenine glycosylase [Burkholderiales bacterium]|nr:MAG: A/G-specific adenine glycosylase [Burkholderiales bacterium]TAG83268.1 MAG: A/G-specific adenine glycosylase [Betaproteobacteria bacterium]